MEGRSKVNVYWFIVYLVHAVGSPGGVDLGGMQRLSHAGRSLSLFLFLSLYLSLSLLRLHSLLCQWASSTLLWRSGA